MMWRARQQLHSVVQAWLCPRGEEQAFNGGQKSLPDTAFCASTVFPPWKVESVDDFYLPDTLDSELLKTKERAYQERIPTYPFGDIAEEQDSVFTGLGRVYEPAIGTGSEREYDEHELTSAKLEGLHLQRDLLGTASATMTAAGTRAQTSEVRMGQCPSALIDPTSGAEHDTNASTKRDRLHLQRDLLGTASATMTATGTRAQTSEVRMGQCPSALIDPTSGAEHDTNASTKRDRLHLQRDLLETVSAATRATSTRAQAPEERMGQGPRELTGPTSGAKHDTNAKPVIRTGQSFRALVCPITGIWVLMALCVFLTLVVPASAEAGSTNADQLRSSEHATIAMTRLGSLSHRTLSIFGLVLLSITAGAVLCHMMPAMGGVQRMPPSWDPAHQSRYSFRSWTQDLLVWSIATEMDPSRKAALVVMALRGTAQAFARSIPPQALITGGQINGVVVDPLTFLLHALSERFAALGDEIRLTSLTDMLGFERSSPYEQVDELMARFDLVRSRAQEFGQLVISVPGLAWLLLKACGVNDAQLLQVLTPFGGQFPQTEADLNVLKAQLRRLGHVLEGSPGNVAQALRSRGTQPSAYWMYPEGDETSDGHGQEQAWHASNQAYEDQSWGGGNAHQDVWFEGSSDGGTDTDTCSSLGDASQVELPAVEEGETPEEALFWAYQRAKSMWRRYTGKPTRAVRRFGRHYIRRKGSSKGHKGKGKGRPNVSTFLASLNDEEVAHIYKGIRKGKGKGKRSSGKGKGRRRNPKGRDGQVLRCFKCGSDSHLSRECPQRPSSSMQSSVQHADNQPRNFWVQQPEQWSMPADGPLSGLIFMAAPVSPDDDPPSESAMPSFHTHAESNAGANTQDHPRATDPWAEYLRGRGVFNEPPRDDRMPYPPRASAEARHEHHASAVPNPFANVNGQVPPGDQTAAPSATYWQLPPATLPQWVQLPGMEFLMQPGVTATPEPIPLIRGAAGQPETAPSQVDSTQAPLLQSIFDATSATTRRWLQQPAAIAAVPLQAQSGLEQANLRMVDSFHQSQTAIATRRQATKKAQRGTFTLPEVEDRQSYDAVEGVCAICQEDFRERESVMRLACRHVFHSQCWAGYLLHDQVMLACPVCRGSARVVARFNYIEGCEFVRSPVQSQQGSRAPSEPRPEGAQSGPEGAGNSRDRTPDRRAPSQAETFNMSTPPPRDPPTSEETPSPYARPWTGLHFPWWPAYSPPTSDVEPVYHKTIHDPMRSTLLVDPGAFTNLVGLRWVREMTAKAQEHGKAPTQRRLQQPMYVQGVGHGSQKCEWSVRMPISVPSIVDGVETVAPHFFEAPIVAEQGAHLPALLGLKSLREKAAVLVLSPDDDELRLIVPGPGGISIDPSPGSIQYPLMVAATGHLLLACDRFENVSTASLPSRSLNFQAEPAQPAAAEHRNNGFEHGLPVQPSTAEPSPSVPTASASQSTVPEPSP